jgi:hypothetical protein
MTLPEVVEVGGTRRCLCPRTLLALLAHANFSHHG